MAFLDDRLKWYGDFPDPHSSRVVGVIALKKLLAVFAVAVLSACGVAEQSNSQGGDAVGRVESAVCGSCPSGSLTNVCTSPLSPDCDHNGGEVNDVGCLVPPSYLGTAFAYCNAGNGKCRASDNDPYTHYPAWYSRTYDCHTNRLTEPSFNNTLTCLPLPDSGTIESCGFCPPGWTVVSHAPNAERCTSSRVVEELYTCTKNP